VAVFFAAPTAWVNDTDTPQKGKETKRKQRVHFSPIHAVVTSEKQGVEGATLQMHSLPAQFRAVFTDQCDECAARRRLTTVAPALNA